MPRYEGFVCVNDLTFTSSAVGSFSSIKKAQNVAAMIAFNSFSSSLPGSSTPTSEFDTKEPIEAVTKSQDIPIQSSVIIHDSTEFFDSSTTNFWVPFDGLRIQTIVTNTAKIVDEWIEKVSSTFIRNNELIVGLDTEFMTDENGKHKVALVQLCVEDKCLLFHLARMDYIPESLKKFMMDSNNKFVGVAVNNDIKMLKRDYGLECSNSVDVAILAITKWPDRYSCTKSPGLKLLAKDLVSLDLEKSKEVSTSKWQLKNLDKNQVEYACIDAYASYKIGKKLLCAA